MPHCRLRPPHSHVNKYPGKRHKTSSQYSKSLITNILQSNIHLYSYNKQAMSQKSEHRLFMLKKQGVSSL